MLVVGYLAMDLRDRTRTIHFKGKLTHYTITKIFQMQLLLNKNRASDSSRYIREFEATRDSSSFSIFIIKEWTIVRPPFQAQEKYPRKRFRKRESFGGTQNDSALEDLRTSLKLS